MSQPVPRKFSSRNLHFPAREHHRQPAWRLRRNDLTEPGQVDDEYRFVQERQGCLGLVLRGCRNLAIRGQMAEEGLHFGRAHVARMAKPVEPDEEARPVDVGAFGAERLVPDTDLPSDFVDEARA